MSIPRKCSIIHLDLDAFFASVEQRDNPVYRDKPLIVGGILKENGRLSRRGVVCAASYQARKYGVHAGMPIWEGLGGTEMMHLVTSNTMSDIPMPDSIGKALPGFEIKVVREDGTTAGPGEVGSMLIKGPTATLYWKPYIQDNKLLKTMKKGIKDGYNMMGDAVVIDKDGFIFFQAREDDMIKSSGFRLAPSEIEDAILRHPAVRDNAVVGIPDEVLGQKVVAMVELEPGHTASQDLASDIIKSTMDVLGMYKLPREVVFMESIPRTPTGKILKKVLRKDYPEYPTKYVPKVK